MKTETTAASGTIGTISYNLSILFSYGSLLLRHIKGTLEKHTGLMDQVVSSEAKGSILFPFLWLLLAHDINICREWFKVDSRLYIASSYHHSYDIVSELYLCEVITFQSSPLSLVRIGLGLEGSYNKFSRVLL